MLLLILPRVQQEQQPLVLILLYGLLIFQQIIVLKQLFFQLLLQLIKLAFQLLQQQEQLLYRPFLISI
jgi:hypothetical protein